MTPTQIKAALEQLGGRPNKSLGQHFLTDKTALEAIVQAADISPGDRVLEVGPGLGVLTRTLLERGAQIMAIEKDGRFVDYLADLGNLALAQGDAAKLDWDTIVGEKPWKFVSNLPYAITSLALRKALYAKRPPTDVVVLVQREVAERIVERPTSKIQRPKTSLLSLMVALASAKTEIIRRVPAGAFYPPPKVESAILKIVPMSNVERRTRWGIEPEEVMQVAKKGFAHPRKLVQRNLGIADDLWRDMAAKGSFEVKARAEDLSVEQWATLALRLE